MSEGKSGWRIALNIVGAMLGLLVFGAGGCSDIFAGQCNCPAPVHFAVIHLGCVPMEPPVVKTTGPCSVCVPSQCGPTDNSQNINLTSDSAGTCHVELIFGSGATSSVDLDFMSQWLGCGSDPHGCGQAIVAATTTVPVPEPTCDAGLDAEPSD